MVQLPLGFVFDDEPQKAIITTQSHEDIPLEPKPLEVARKWGFPLAIVDVNGDPENYLYSVQDWIMGIAGANARSAAVTSQKLRYQFEINTFKHPYQTQGGVFEMDYALAKALYLIAQEMRVTKKRPQLREIKDFLAAAGVIVDWERRNPEQAAELHAARAKGKKQRLIYTDEVKRTHITNSPRYGQLTDMVYRIVLGESTTGLQRKLRLTKSQKLRDNLAPGALAAVSNAEQWASIGMSVHPDRTLTDADQQRITHDMSEIEREAYAKRCARLGIDPITNTPLLNG